jgi:hypothetical protein
MYLKVAKASGPFGVYRIVNFNSRGAHIKGLANGTEYLAYVTHTVDGQTSRTETVSLTPKRPRA